MTDLDKSLVPFRSSFKVKLFFWKSIPSLFFWKVKIEKATLEETIVSVPFHRKTKNPFRSTYFAALAGAAELSTGLIPFAYTQGKKVSMLVTGFEASFHKKAKTTTYFSCKQGADIVKTIDEALLSGEGQELDIHAEGKNEAGEVVMKAVVKWSFKAK